MLFYFIITALAAIICFTIMTCRMYVKRMFAAIDHILNRLSNQDLSSFSQMSEDNRISKLENQANRIINQYLSEMTHVKNEKDGIQAFISDISHQFKTPLAGLLMYSEMLLEGGLSQEEQEEFLGRIKASTERLQWMTDSLIKISRLEVGTIQLTPSIQPISKTISHAINHILADSIEKNITINLQKFEEQYLYYDRKWTLEALINILENAIKYSHSGGKIDIAIEPLSMYTKLTVTDNGIGINRSEWNLIFKRFYRGENATNYEGIGLGLHLATLIMENQGGYIMVDSIPNQYTTFSLFLQNCQK